MRSSRDCHQKSGTAIKAVMIIFILAIFAGCDLGPRAISDGREKFNRAVGNSQSSMLLLNLVKMRYRDRPSFLQITSISSNPQFSATMGLNFRAGAAPDQSSGNLVPLSLGGTYSENPTITYAPLSGEAFVRQMLTPVPLETMLLLLQSGWPVDRVMRLAVQELNDLQNASPAAGPTPDLQPAFEDFLRASKLLEVLQRNRVIEWSYGSKGQAQLRLVLNHEKAGDLQRLRMLRDLLGISSDAIDIPVIYAVGYANNKTLTIVTRSMNDILFYVSQSVDVPPQAVEDGLVTVTRNLDGEVFEWDQLSGDLIDIRWSPTRPENAYMAVQYRGNWYYIADDDLDSKTTFLLVDLFMDLQSGSVQGAAPVLTIPVSR